MKESQNIEWKELWRDEYIKWICGFANANGGTLYIGKDNKGKVTGISDAEKLLKDIPNKVRDILGIMIDVNLITEKGKDILEIIAEPYPYPVSYKGQYHYRSGSTKQELKGVGLAGRRSSRQGCNPVGESPTVSVARVGHVVMPHLGAGNQPSYAWRKRPGCPVVLSNCGGCNLEV